MCKAIDPGGGQDVCVQPQLDQVPAAGRVAEGLGQPLRFERLGPQGQRQGELVQPHLLGRDAWALSI